MTLGVVFIDKDVDSMDELDNESMDLEDCYTVVKDFTKSAIDELDLKVGQMVCVIDDSDSGTQLFYLDKHKMISILGSH